jgi:hypothetical protein
VGSDRLGELGHRGGIEVDLGGGAVLAQVFG